MAWFLIQLNAQDLLHTFSSVFDVSFVALLRTSASAHERTHKPNPHTASAVRIKWFVRNAATDGFMAIKKEERFWCMKWQEISFLICYYFWAVWNKHFSCFPSTFQRFDIQIGRQIFDTVHDNHTEPERRRQHQHQLSKIQKKKKINKSEQFFVVCRCCSTSTQSIQWWKWNAAALEFHQKW